MRGEGGLSLRREGKSNKTFTNVSRNGDVSKDGKRESRNQGTERSSCKDITKFHLRSCNHPNSSKHLFLLKIRFLACVLMKTIVALSSPYEYMEVIKICVLNIHI